jgi:hypothetical protein
LSTRHTNDSCSRAIENFSAGCNSAATSTVNPKWIAPRYERRKKNPASTISHSPTRIIDLDVHRIPALGKEPEHHHHDVRFLLVAQHDELRISSESLDLRWFERRELAGITDEESILRLARKSFAALDGLG